MLIQELKISKSLAEIQGHPKRLQLLIFMVFEHFWARQGTFLVQDFQTTDHRPNGVKILRFQSFPHTLTYPGCVENCQKSMSFSKILVGKSWNFGYFLDRTRKQPHFQYIGHFLTMMGGRFGQKKWSNLNLV